MLDFEKAEQIARRMAASSAGQDSAEWLLAAALIRYATDNQIAEPKKDRQPHKDMIKLSHVR